MSYDNNTFSKPGIVPDWVAKKSFEIETTIKELELREQECHDNGHYSLNKEDGICYHCFDGLNPLESNNFRRGVDISKDYFKGSVFPDN